MINILGTLSWNRCFLHNRQDGKTFLAQLRVLESKKGGEKIFKEKTFAGIYMASIFKWKKRSLLQNLSRKSELFEEKN